MGYTRHDDLSGSLFLKKCSSLKKKLNTKSKYLYAAVLINQQHIKVPGSLRLWRSFSSAWGLFLCTANWQWGQAHALYLTLAHTAGTCVLDSHIPKGAFRKPLKFWVVLQTNDGNVGHHFPVPSNVINRAFFSCWIPIAMKASMFVLPANTSPFFLSGLSESHNSVLNLFGMNKYSGYNRARKCDYPRIRSSISTTEARRHAALWIHV